MKILVAITCAGIAAFCAFGFLAAAELPAQKMKWQAGYAVVGLSTLAFGVSQLRK